MPLEKRFNHKEQEDKIYAEWEKSGFFSPEKCIEKGVCKKDAEVFSIVLPPPNVTGTLHMGHAAMLAIEDIMIRFARMRGKRALWIPGTDHAAIATQEKVERLLYEKEKKTRHDLGREKFLEKVNDFAKESHDRIVFQLKKMGASLDWSREAFTLDNTRNLAVNTAFEKMYDAGLIFRGGRIVNWDPKMQTTVSDDEIEWTEEKASFYYFKYGPFVIGTARPETKFGDKYVVMHPEDKRYEKYKHGEKFETEWINGKITATIIKDEAVDPEFGTGVMTITPWHDNADFEIAERHNLDKEQIIGLDGKLLDVAEELAGMPILQARPKIVEKLKAKGLLEKIDENYIHRIAKSSRGGGFIEPQIMEQWFVDVNKKFKPPLWQQKIKKSRNQEITKKEASLKELMKQSVESGQIEILPERFRKVYFHWIDNLRNWCISRQIWYGHRIPVWYCKNRTSDVPNIERSPKVAAHLPTPERSDDGQEGRTSNVKKMECNEPIVSVEKIKKCPHCGGNIEQDPDTLDTWFSSGLWTFSTLGWPSFAPTFAKATAGKKASEGKPLATDLDIYHPTSVLETGYDILFFWVARMILMSTALLGEIPFHKVYLHGLVRDEEGKKMSKSLGNVIDPIDMIEKFGADATRLSLVVGTGPGNDTKLNEDKVRSYRNFSTKVWNVGRFLDMNRPDGYDRKKAEGFMTKEDKKCLKELESVKKEITDHYEKMEFHLAGEKAYHYLWDTFANNILEERKERLKDNDNDNDPSASLGASKHGAYFLLESIYKECLKMLHPFMPFVTEEVFGHLNLGDGLLMTEAW